MIILISTIIRTTILYFTVTIAIRLMGKRQIGDMQPNELVVTLLISETAAIPLQDMNQPILSGITCIFVLVIIEIILSVVSMKSFFFRKIMSGKSAVVIKNGKIDQKVMNDVRMTVLDLIELLRGQSVFNISDVAYAVLEVNGDLSVLLKSEMQPATLKDLNIKSSPAGFSLPVISDGKIITESLRSLQIDKSTVENKLKANGLICDDVFLMMLDRYDNISIVKKEQNV